jgi:hypothetical protein
LLLFERDLKNVEVVMDPELVRRSVVDAFCTVKWHTSYGARTLTEMFECDSYYTLNVEIRLGRRRFSCTYQSASVGKSVSLSLVPAFSQDLITILKLCNVIRDQSCHVGDADICFDKVNNMAFCYDPLQSYDPPDLIVDDLEKDKEEWLSPMLAARRLKPRP